MSMPLRRSNLSAKALAPRFAYTSPTSAGPKQEFAKVAENWPLPVVITHRIALQMSLRRPRTPGDDKESQ